MQYLVELRVLDTMDVCARSAFGPFTAEEGREFILSTIKPRLEEKGWILSQKGLGWDSSLVEDEDGLCTYGTRLLRSEDAQGYEVSVDLVPLHASFDEALRFNESFASFIER